MSTWDKAAVKDRLLASGASSSTAERATNCIARAIRTHQYDGTPCVGHLVGLSWEEATRLPERDLTAIVNFGASCMEFWRAAFGTPVESDGRRQRWRAPWLIERDAEIVKLRDLGWTYEAIGERFYLSHSRVGQIVKRCAASTHAVDMST